MPKGGKFDRCVKHVKAKVENPYAVCNKSVKHKGTKKGTKK